jgi:predicted amidophosphoribosyltransferase
MTEGELLRAYLADHDHPCPRCGYNLRGLASPVCPECGTGLSLRILPTDAAAPADPAVEVARLREFLARRDARCPRCRRGLRGHDSGTCPGCGLPLSVWLLRPPGLDSSGRRVVWVLLLGAVVAAAFLYVAVWFLIALGRLP